MVLCVTSVCRPTAGAEPSDSLMDKFSIDRSRNIMRPENFGIANGKITTGIDCDDLLAIRGIWAPPFVSSDFTLQMSIGGQPVGVDRIHEPQVDTARQWLGTQGFDDRQPCIRPIHWNHGLGFRATGTSYGGSDWLLHERPMPLR